MGLLGDTLILPSDSVDLKFVRPCSIFSLPSFILDLLGLDIIFDIFPQFDSLTYLREI